MFVDIQGEGSLMGQRCLFIRVVGCGLCDMCLRFCGNVDGSIGMDADVDRLSGGLVDIISKRDIRNVVITGGEPMLYVDEFFQVIDSVGKECAGVLWQFETSGTIPVDLKKTVNYIDNTNVNFVILPRKDRYFHESYYGLYRMSLRYGEPCVMFKFIVYPTGGVPFEDSFPFYNEDEVSVEIFSLIEQGVNRNDIWLVPFARWVDELDDIARDVYLLSKMLDVNFSDKLNLRYGMR